MTALNDTTNPPLKRCSKCKREFPATTEYFHKSNQQRGGLTSSCCECRSTHALTKRYGAEGYKQLRSRQEEAVRLEANNQRRCVKCEKILPLTNEYFYARKNNPAGLDTKCRECAKSQIAITKYGQTAHDESENKREQAARLLQLGFKVCSICKRALPANSSYFPHCASGVLKLLSQCRECASERRGYHRSRRVQELRVRSKCSNNRRRARKESLPSNFIEDDWHYALEYFHGCCAVCNRPLVDLFSTHTAAQDHWIPITDPRPDNPGTVPHNILPLCHGENGCNNRKRNRDPVSFLEETFGKRRSRRILDRINAFFMTTRVIRTKEFRE